MSDKNDELGTAEVSDSAAAVIEGPIPEKRIRPIQRVFNTLDEMEDFAWSELIRAACVARSEFHLPTVATLDADGLPTARVVTLRRVQRDHGWLQFHADLRSPKAQQTLANPSLAWLFYSRRHSFQIRLQTRAVVHHQDDVANEAWQGTELMSRRCYMMPQAPGTTANEATTGLPPEIQDEIPTEDQSREAYQNFSVVRAWVQSMDLYHIAWDRSRRAIFHYETSPDVSGSGHPSDKVCFEKCWLTP